MQCGFIFFFFFFGVLFGLWVLRTVSFGQFCQFKLFPFKSSFSFKFFFFRENVGKIWSLRFFGHASFFRRSGYLKLVAGIKPGDHDGTYMTGYGWDCGES